jgi:hypothetical protein
MRALYTQIWHTMPPPDVKPLDAASRTHVQYMTSETCAAFPCMGDIAEALWKDGTPEGHDDEPDQNKRFPGSSTRLANATTPCLALPQRDCLSVSLTDSSMTATRTINPGS